MNSQQLRITLYDSRLQKDADDFLELFEQINIITSKDTPLFLKDKAHRSCRFFGKSMPEVKFNKEAHVISRLPENRLLVSDLNADGVTNSLAQTRHRGK